MLKKVLPFYLLFSFQLFGLQVGKIQWGFNNKIKKQTFNFVSFEVLNDSPSIFDSEITFQQSGSGVSSILKKKLFLNPGQRKTVQFYCYLDHNYNDWLVKWDGNQAYIPKAPESEGAFSYIAQGFSPVRMDRGISLFPAASFPTTVSMTDDLEGAVLDHNPDWSPLQREAFMDWLKKGGVLYILNDRSQTKPQFTSIMSELNSPEDRFFVGNGRVYREKISISSFKKPYYDKSDRINEVDSDSSEYFQALQYLVKTDHNWSLIYFLIFVYLVIIGPVNFLIGKKTRDWKVPNLFFLVTVAGFSILFSIIGRRGYGEETKLTSVSLADQIVPGKYDVNQWTNIFVTSGDLYTLSHKGTTNLYYSHSEIGKKTIIDADANSFTADIPLFSSRRMIHRAKLDGPAFNVEVVPGQGINSSAVKVTSKDAKIDKVWIIRNGAIYRTAISSGIYEETSQVENYYDSYGYREYRDAYEEIEKSLIQRLQMSRKTYFSYNTDTRVQNNLMYAVVRAKTPETFHFGESNIDGQESGWTYFRILINTDRAN